MRIEEELGTNPSSVWRSLLAAREILRVGSKWRVGDGRVIDVREQTWLPHAPVFNGEPPPSVQVSELIDESSICGIVERFPFCLHTQLGRRFCPYH